MRSEAWWPCGVRWSAAADEPANAMNLEILANVLAVADEAIWGLLPQP